MAKQKLRGTFVFPARGASQENVDKTIAQATDEIKETVYKSVAGLEVELNKAASVTANGTLVVEPSDGKDVMEKATVTVAVPLEDNKAATIDVSQYASAVEVTPSDGKTAMKKATVTLSNIPVLEANKTATIDASSYTEPIEIEPTEGKDGMAKAVVSLTNIPGEQSLYIWSYSSGSVILPVGTFEEITIEMKGVGCNGGSESMFDGTVTAKTDEEFEFKSLNNEFTISISASDTVTEFPDLT